jgi:hypothetical protein
MKPEVGCDINGGSAREPVFGGTVLHAFTSQHRMRAPSYKGIREDKVPEDAIAEE